MCPERFDLRPSDFMREKEKLCSCLSSLYLKSYLVKLDLQQLSSNGMQRFASLLVDLGLNITPGFFYDNACTIMDQLPPPPGG